MIRKIVAVFFALVVMVGWVDAAPAISNVSGTVASGQSITITGTGFGTKANPGPIKFDDFENGTNGGYLHATDGEWDGYEGGDGVTYTNSTAHSGSLSVGVHNVGGENFVSNYYTYPTPSSGIFVSYWWRTVDADVVGDPCDYTVIKMTRMTSSVEAGGGGIYNGPGNTSLGGTFNVCYSAGPYFAYSPDNSEHVVGGFEFPPLNQWFKVEMYKKLSTPGEADGIAECRLVGIDYHSENSAITRAAGQSFLMNTVLLGTEDGAVPTHDYYIRLDDMYIDSVRTRIEIGDSATWSSCKIHETQIATAWSDTEVQINAIRMGLFTTGTGYIYVVHEDGSVNTNGYEVTFGSTSNQIRCGVWIR